MPTFPSSLPRARVLWWLVSLLLFPAWAMAQETSPVPLEPQSEVVGEGARVLGDTVTEEEITLPPMGSADLLTLPDTPPLLDVDKILPSLLDGEGEMAEEGKAKIPPPPPKKWAILYYSASSVRGVRPDGKGVLTLVEGIRKTLEDRFNILVTSPPQRDDGKGRGGDGRLLRKLINQHKPDMAILLQIAVRQESAAYGYADATSYFSIKAMDAHTKRWFVIVRKKFSAPVRIGRFAADDGLDKAVRSVSAQVITTLNARIDDYYAPKSREWWLQPSSTQAAAKKSAAGEAGEAVPVDGNAAEEKPVAEGDVEDKLAVDGAIEDKPAADGTTEDKPVGDGAEKPVVDGTTGEAPASDGVAEDKLTAPPSEGTSP